MDVSKTRKKEQSCKRESDVIRLQKGFTLFGKPKLFYNHSNMATNSHLNPFHLLTTT